MASDLVCQIVAFTVGVPLHPDQFDVDIVCFEPLSTCIEAFEGSFFGQQWAERETVALSDTAQN